MNISPVERKVLWAAIEDFTGLWELVWEVASSCPEVSESDRQLVVQRAVRNLLTLNCLELYERFELGGKEQLVPSARWDELLSNQENWREPSAISTEVLVGATSTGERLYATHANDGSSL